MSSGIDPKKRTAADESNLRVARIILADPESSIPGLVDWARLFMERWERERKERRDGK